MAPRSSTRSAKIASQQLRPRKRISYKESDSSSDLSDQPAESSSDDSASADGRLRREHWRRSPSSNHWPSRYPSRSSNKRRAPPARDHAHIALTKKARSEKTPERDEEDTNAVSDVDKEPDKVPPWQSLPHHILTQIFFYASPHLWTDDFLPNPSMVWLLQCARLCRSFAEPALSALYYSPPLTPPDRARGLMECLASQTEHSASNYRSKVKYLDVEAHSTLARKYKGRDPINLGDLVQLTPQLRGVRIHRAPPRMNWYRDEDAPTSNRKPIYQECMFTALQIQRIALREWIWNAQLAGYRYSVTNLRGIHSNSAFQSLQTLTFIRYDEKDSTEEELADAIKTLPALKRLIFRMSLIVNQKLLRLLPHQLESLEMVKCLSLTSSVLSEFLSTHGRELLELNLDQNPALNLSFLTEFAAACPKIQVLGINLRLYHSHYRLPGLGPKVDRLLLEDETPTWPASLASLELLHLHKWDLNVAERFFSSLVDSAHSLPKLRRLNIKASLQSGWRDRVSFRDKWTSRLEQVFLRVSEPPSPQFKSMAAFKAYKDQLLAQLEAKVKQQRPSLRLMAPKQSSKFMRVEIKQDTPTATAYSESDSDAPLATIRRSRRLKKQDMSKRTRRIKLDRGSDESSSSESGSDDGDEYVSPKTSSPLYRRRPRRKKGSDESSSSEDSALDDDAAGEEASEEVGLFKSKQDEFYIQGLCDVVHISIDNLRPTEEQLNEDDFLDNERSGDEDWNGDGDVGESGYAW